MNPDKPPRFQADPEIEEQFRSRVLQRSWDRRFKDVVETPGRLAAVWGLLAGLAIAATYGLMIGSTDLQVVALLSAGLVFVFLLVVAGEYWWALLVVTTALGIRTTEFGFRMTGFELGFAAVVAAYLIRSALRAMKKFKPSAGLGLPFWALFLYLLFHAALVITYQRYDGGSGLKNIVRGYYSILAPLSFFFLLGAYCHPRTVKPVTLVFLGVTAFTTFVSILVFLFQPTFLFLAELPFSLAWLDKGESAGVLRGAPILATFAIALWPAMRTVPRKLFMASLIGLSILAAAASSGRLAFAGVFLVTMLFLVLNKKWGAVTGACAALGVMTLVFTTSPHVAYALPETMQRAVSPLNLGDSDMKRNIELSDRWHSELRRDSFYYWTETWVTFLVGHGYGAWDESLNKEGENWTGDFEYAKKMAIQMGKTENVFSSITNVFGLIGLLFYSWFALDTVLRLFKARKLSPPRSFEKSMCEVSLVYLAMFLVLSPFAGGAPGWDIFYWQLGLLATRPLLAKTKENEPLPDSAENFARPDRPVFDPRSGRPLRPVRPVGAGQPRQPVMPGRRDGPR